MRKIYLDWEDIGICIDCIVQTLRASKLKFDGVYGVPRGGLILAVAVSNQLNIPLLVHPTENSLVCDDISDTGITLSNIKHKKIACLYSSEWTKTKPDYYMGVKHDKKSWIIFPWEEYR